MAVVMVGQTAASDWCWVARSDLSATKWVDAKAVRKAGKRAVQKADQKDG